jgi:hypothetical protein
MSTIERFFTDSLVIRRSKAVPGSTYGRAMQATATVDGRVEDEQREEGPGGQGVYSQTFFGWIADDVSVVPIVGDQVTDGDGRIYEVKDINLRNFGINQHFELILERYNPEDRE